MTGAAARLTLGCLLMLAIAGAAIGSDAIPETFPKRAGSFPPLPACTLEYSFGWSDLVEAARATAIFRPEAEISRVTVRGGTSGAARLLWRMDARHDAMIDSLTLQGRWAEQYERYRNRNIEGRVAFEPRVGVHRYRRVNPDRNLTARWRTFHVPGAFDLLGSVLFIRSQPLRDGDSLRLIGFPGDSAYFVEVDVVRRETIRILDEDRPAIRMTLRVRKIDFEKKEPVGLSEYGRFRSGTFWMSDDELRIPLRAEVRVFIGSVTGELVGFQRD